MTDHADSATWRSSGIVVIAEQKARSMGIVTLTTADGALPTPTPDGTLDL